MAGKESDVVLNFKTNGEVSYSKTIKEINKEMNLAAAEYKNQVSAMDKDATQTEKLRAAKQKLEKQLGLAEQRSQMLREEYEKSVKETGEYSAESEKLYKQLLNSETGENKLRTALEQTNDALKEQGDVSVDTAKKLQKIEETGEKVKGVGEKMSVGVTAPIVAAGAAGLAAFGEVDEQLDKIITTTGATGEKADSLGESFKNVGKDTHLGLDMVGDAVGAVYQQLGMMGPELEKNSDYAMKFAEINETSVTSSVTNAKSAIEAYNLTNKDFGSVLDSVSAASQKTGVSVDDLFQKAVDGAPQIKQLGLGFGETVNLLGQLEKQGVDSGGALSLMSKAAAGYAKENKSLSEGFEDLQNKIKNASSETEAINLAAEVFGTKGASKMVDAIKRGTFNLEELAETSKNTAGTVGEVFDATKDPVDEADKAMNNAIIAMADVGESVQVSLLPFFEKATSLLKEFSEWWGSLDQDTKNWIITIAGIAAAVGPVLIVLGSLMGSVTKIVGGVKSFIGIWQAMSTFLAANPFVLVIAGIALLIAGFVLAYNKVKWFRDGVNTFFQGISDIAVQVFNFLGGFIGGVFGGIIANFNDYFNAGKRIFNGFLDFITGVFTGNWSKAWNGVVNIFGGIFEGIAAIAKVPINGMIVLINGFIGGLNKIKVPKWVPGIGGKSFSISKIPYLAQGGHLINGQAIVGEAGPELLSAKNGKTTVTPLSDDEKRKGISGKVGGGTIEQHIHISKVDANNPSELDRLNRKIAKADQQAIYDLGGVTR